MNLTKSPLKLYASVKAVIVQLLYLPGNNRVSNIVNRVKEMADKDVQSCLNKVRKDFANRHRNLEQIFLAHFRLIEKQYEAVSMPISDSKQLLLGAYFTKEYSIQAAALFNPSIVPHPQQQGLKPGELRFVMSLRATGEGHISSVVFQTGIVDSKANITLDESPQYFTRLDKAKDSLYTKDFIRSPLIAVADFDERILSALPDSFTAAQAGTLLKSLSDKDSSLEKSIRYVDDVIDLNYELESAPDLPVNEKVIFPCSRAESMGMEDVRFVQFKDGNHSCYYGTYTAYDGKQIRTQLIETTDFSVFKIRSLSGEAISDKGMALFPEKVNGKYVMIARQGGEKINIMFSADLYRWEEFEILMEPKYAWELVQLGNCGSPVKTGKGWLLLTHGVGPMRTYVISAILLDLNNPSRVIGRLDKPLIEANQTEREGYVPNVVYTCGCMLHQNVLIIPYAVSDAATGFAAVLLNELLNEMIYQ